jgi:hypothetical protein
MANNVDLGSFNFHCTKNPFFIFLAQKNEFFCEASIKNTLQKCTNKILNNIIPYFMNNSPVVSWKSFYSQPSRN